MEIALAVLVLLGSLVSFHMGKGAGHKERLDDNRKVNECRGKLYEAQWTINRIKTTRSTAAVDNYEPISMEKTLVDER